MENFTAYKTDELNSTHVVTLKGQNVKYNFNLNLSILLSGKGDEKARQEKIHKDFTDFFNTVQDLKAKLYETFHLKYTPIYFALDLIDPEDELVMNFIKLLQNTLKSMFEIDVSDLMCVVAKTDKQTQIILPVSRVETAFLQTIRERMLYLCDNEKDGQLFGEPASQVLSCKYQNGVNLSHDGAICYPYLENDTQPYTLVSAAKFKQCTPAQLISFAYRIVKPWNYTKDFLRLKKKTNKANVKKGLIKDIVVKTNFEKLRELAKMLKPERCANFLDFKDLGQAIYNIAYQEDALDEAFEIWKELAKESDQLDSCEETWDAFEQTEKPTIGMIIHFAKIDSPDTFKVWQKNNMYERLKACLYPDAGPTDFAKILFSIYEGRFICASNKDDTWYEFVGHYYKEMDGPLAISQAISNRDRPNSLVSLFYELKKDLEKGFEGAPEDEKEACEELIKKCNKVISGLKTPAFKSQIIKESKEEFYNENFLKKMNTNENLIAFENGVLDFTDTVKSKDVYVEPTFRAGRPDDMITIAINYDYKTYSWSDPKVKFVLNHFRKVFTNSNVRKYYWRLIASILVGCNRDKILPFFTGPKGNNAKSVCMEMLEKAFGELCKKVNYSFLTQERKDSGATTSDLVLVRYARLVICNEADADKKLRSSMVKELTGNDSMQIRDLFKKAENFNPQFKIIVIANNAPPYDSKDDAMKNRIKVVEFNSQFVDRVAHPTLPKTEEEQYAAKMFEVDKDFRAKIKEIVQPFMWLMVQHFRYYQMEGLNEPNEVLQSTAEYTKMNNHVLQYVEEALDRVQGYNTPVAQLYDSYKSWYQQSGMDIKSVLTKGDFKSQIVKLGFTENKKTISIENVRFK